MIGRRIPALPVRHLDRLVHRFFRRRVVVHLRNAMHVAVLDPVLRILDRDGRVDVRYVAEKPSRRAHIEQAIGRRLPWMSARRAAWTRIDLFVTADPWSPPVLHRCLRRVNFFHGVAGKYNLDDPATLPIGFDLYDRVAFVNSDRMRRYLEKGIVKPEAAALVGFPRLDALVNGRINGAAVRDRLGLEMHRRTALYAPTWSPASSLNVAGAHIVRSLVDHGWNVIVKPHDLSFDPEPKYSGGIDWRKRLRDVETPGRVVVTDQADPSPLLAASDLMVTDHSSIGFEFCLLDRPLVVFDAPDLARVARINPERIAALRSAARVVSDAAAVGLAANDEMAQPSRRAAERAAVARPLFYEPGTATDRALQLVYDLLDLPAYHVRDVSGSPHPVGASI